MLAPLRLLPLLKLPLLLLRWPGQAAANPVKPAANDDYMHWSEQLIYMPNLRKLPADLLGKADAHFRHTPFATVSAQLDRIKEAGEQEKANRTVLMQMLNSLLSMVRVPTVWTQDGQLGAFAGKLEAGLGLGQRIFREDFELSYGRFTSH